MKIIQETETIIIYRDTYQSNEARFVKTKATGEIHIFAEDIARNMGFSDIHDMISSENILEAMNFSNFEPGLYPFLTLTLAEADALLEVDTLSIDIDPDTEEEKMTFFADNYSQDIDGDPTAELADDLEYLIEGNRTIMSAVALPCNVKQSGDGPVSEWTEFALELQADASGLIVLLKEDIKFIDRILNRYKPAE